MLIYPSLESLLPKAENRYVLTMLAAKRARQLTDGANPMVESETPNYVSLASEELYADKVVYRKGRLQPHVPLRPEIEAAKLLAEREAREKRELEYLEEAKRSGEVETEALQRSIIASVEANAFEGVGDAEEMIRQFVKIVDQENARDNSDGKTEA